MKKSLFIVLLTVTVGSVMGQAKKTPAKATAPATSVLKTSRDSLSYAIGLLDGNFFKNQGVSNVSAQSLGRGFDDALKGNALMTAEQADMLVRREMQASARRKVQPNIDAGAKFLAENGKRPGVKTTSTGLQYEVIKEGNGVHPVPADTIIMHYVGSTIDGKVFESSRTNGQPLVYPLHKLIQGWVEGVQLMSIGAHYKLYIPYQMAYGEQGSGDAIPGGSTLIFDLELLDIKKSNQ